MYLVAANRRRTIYIKYVCVYRGAWELYFCETFESLADDRARFNERGPRGAVRVQFCATDTQPIDHNNDDNDDGENKKLNGEGKCDAIIA